MNLYLEGLLLEVTCDDQTFLYETIKETWPDMFKHEPPQGASLSDETKVVNNILQSIFTLLSSRRRIVSDAIRMPIFRDARRIRGRKIKVLERSNR